MVSSMPRLEPQSQDWDSLARLDPLWAICSRPDTRNGRWSPGEFFRTGEQEVAAVLARPEAQPERRRVALDFGCGLGRLTRALATRFDHCRGVDGSKEMVEQAQRLNADRPNCSFDVGTTLAAVEPRSVDFVYSAFVLQHLGSDHAIADTVTEFLRVVTPDGAVVFQLPERLSLPRRVQLRPRLFALLRRLHVSDEWLYRRARLHPVRMRGLDEPEVRTLVEHAGGRVVRTETVDPAARLGGIRYYVRSRRPDSNRGPLHYE
jgi:SAM-dependent methyltransferase